jgi:hypothetical protein
MEDEFYEEHTALDVLHDIMESDRIFFNGIRFLGGQSRDALIASHLRNTSSALTILREHETRNALPPRPVTTTRMVLNFPLDISGNSAFFDPVPVVPTQTQINAGIDRHIGVTDTVCSICQEAVTCASRIRGCGHCFHDQCIAQWLSMNPRCPMCRFDIRDPPPPLRHAPAMIYDSSINDLRDVSGIQLNESHRVHSDEE